MANPEEIVGKVSDVTQEGLGFMARHPYLCVGLALVVGFCIGWLFGRF